MSVSHLTPPEFLSRQTDPRDGHRRLAVWPVPIIHAMSFIGQPRLRRLCPRSRPPPSSARTRLVRFSWLGGLHARTVADSGPPACSHAARGRRVAFPFPNGGRHKGEEKDNIS